MERDTDNGIAMIPSGEIQRSPSDSGVGLNSLRNASASRSPATSRSRRASAPRSRMDARHGEAEIAQADRPRRLGGKIARAGSRIPGHRRRGYRTGDSPL